MNLYARAIQSLALPSVSLLTRSNFWTLYGQMRRNRNGWVPDLHHTTDKVRELVEHAYQNVPFYRERMDECGLTPGALHSVGDLARLRPTAKADIAVNFPDRITDATESYRPWRYRSSSGTIERLTVIHDFRKRDCVRAADLLSLYCASKYEPGYKLLEIPPDICRNVCGAQGTTEPNVFRFAFENLRAGKLRSPDVTSDLRGLTERQLLFRKLTLPSFDHAGSEQPPAVLDSYLSAIRNFEPHTVKALPLYLYALAKRLQESGDAPPRIRGGLMPMGSSITPHMKRTVEAAFQCKVHEDYGCSELGSLGAECGHQKGVHPFGELFYIEVVRNGVPAAPGELGRVLVTDLTNYAMPFIRYDIGDVAVVRNGTCSCGVGTPRIELQGRVQDCLIGSDDEPIPPDTVTDALFACEGVRSFQVHMTSRTSVDVQLVTSGRAAAVIDAVNATLRDLLGPSVRLFTRPVPTITPESSGKFRMVKNTASNNIRI